VRGGIWGGGRRRRRRRGKLQRYTAHWGEVRQRVYPRPTLGQRSLGFEGFDPGTLEEEVCGATRQRAEPNAGIYSILLVAETSNMMWNKLVKYGN